MKPQEAQLRYKIGFISLIVLLVIHGYFSLNTLYLSTIKFDGMRSIFSADFVGLANFTNIFKDAVLIQSLKNSFYYAVMTMIITAVLVGSVTFGLNQIKNVRLRYILSGVMFFPFLMTFPMLLQKASLAFYCKNPSQIFLSIFFAAVYQSFLLAPFLILGALIAAKRLSIPDEKLIQIVALASIGGAWYVCFCGGNEPFSSFVSIAGNQSLSNYIYSVSFRNMQIGYAAALEILAALLGKSVLLLCLVCIVKLMPSQKQDLQVSMQKTNAVAIAIPGLIISVVLFIVGVMSALGESISVGVDLQTLLLPNLLLAFFPFAGVVLGIALSGLIGQGRIISRVLIIALPLLLLQVGDVTFAEYQVFRQLGMLGTSIPLILNVGVCVLVPALLYGIYIQGTTKSLFQQLAFIGSVYLFMFVSSFGNHGRALIFSQQVNKFPLSLLHRMWTQQYAVQMNFSFPYASIAVGFPLIALGGAIILMIIAMEGNEN